MPHPLCELVSADDLGSVTFVRDYIQLRFNGFPRNLHVMPWVYRNIDGLRPGQSGYTDAVLAQIGHSLADVDQVLDYGLVLDWDNGIRFAVPLDGSGTVGPEAAEFSGHAGTAVWTLGYPPVQWEPMAGAPAG